MDLIMIIVNDPKSRKKIKQYLKNLGMGNFITLPSKGTSDILEAYSGFKSTSESGLDRISVIEPSGKTVIALNKEPERTQALLDDIAELFGQNQKKVDSGIAFSIPINSIF